VTIRPKKIAIFYSGAKYWGGIESYLDLLFANIDKKRFELSLISLGEWPLSDRLKNAGFNVLVLSNKRINPGAVLKATTYLRKYDFDLIVSQGTVANFYARLISLYSGIPSLVTVHSDANYDYPKVFVRAFYNLLDRLLRFQTRRYIAVSEYLKKKLVETGISENRIFVVYNGVESSGIEGAHPSMKPNPGEAVIIGSIGRLHKVKNYAELIRAFSQLPNTSYKLQIIGEGSERANLENLIKELALEDRVEILGNVDNARERLSRFDIYVQPSMSEGFGLTVVEAMLAGLPVIVSPGSALSEIVKDDETGIVLKSMGCRDISLAIEAVLKDKVRAQKIARAAKKYALKNFSISKWINGTEKVFGDFLK